jgi:hypothetical protein
MISNRAREDQWIKSPCMRSFHHASRAPAVADFAGVLDRILRRRGGGIGFKLRRMRYAALAIEASRLWAYRPNPLRGFWGTSPSPHYREAASQNSGLGSTKVTHSLQFVTAVSYWLSRFETWIRGGLGVRWPCEINIAVSFQCALETVRALSSYNWWALTARQVAHRSWRRRSRLRRGQIQTGTDLDD